MNEESYLKRSGFEQRLDRFKMRKIASKMRPISKGEAKKMIEQEKAKKTELKNVTPESHSKKVVTIHDFLQRTDGIRVIWVQDNPVLDFVIAFNKITYLLKVFNPSIYIREEVERKRQLWTGGPYYIIQTYSDALKAIGYSQKKVMGILSAP